VNLNPQSHLERLKKCAAACPTYIQTCMFAIDGQPPTEQAILDYLTLISQVKEVVAGVHLYGLARPSYQVEAARLGRLSEDWLENVASRIRELGLKVYVNP